MGRRRRIYTQAEIDAMVDLVKGHSYEDTAKLMEMQFPPAKYSASQVHTQVKLATGFVPPRETGIPTMPHLAGAALPPSVISQYPGNVSDQSWPVDAGIGQVDNFSQPDWVNPMNNPNEALQYLVANSFNPVTAQTKDPPTMMVEAMNEVFNAIPRIGINSMKNRMLNDVWRKFNPEPIAPQPPQDYTKSVEDKLQNLLTEHKESEKQEQESIKRKEQKERAEHQEYLARLEALLKKVESLPDKKTVTESINPPETLNEKPEQAPIQDMAENSKTLDTHNETADNLGKEPQEKTSIPPEHNPPHDSTGTGTVPPPRLGVDDKLKQPGEEEKHFTGLAGNGNPTGPQPPLIGGESTSTGQADPAVNSQRPEPGPTVPSKPSSPSASSTPPPPPTLPKDQNQNVNGDQSNVQALVVKPQETFLPMQPSVNHNLRNQALTVLLIVGIGVAALYIFNPQVRKFVFSHYVRIFSKAPPQSTPYGTFTQTQQDSYASAQGYARVNNPNDVAFF